jgi:ligand-binding sensor domain-containing protein/serine phosphatase RsbU (regulator of sigma subunit)
MKNFLLTSFASCAALRFAARRRFGLLLLVAFLGSCVLPLGEIKAQSSVKNETRTATFQDSRLRFRTLSIEDGLSQNTILHILQDSRGYLWIGTQDGLNRYDGYDFYTYTQASGDSTSLVANFINHIFEDRQGNVWIATLSGISQYRWVSDDFKTYPLVGQMSLGNKNVRCLFEDKQGLIWAGTDNGIFVLNPNTQRFEPLKGWSGLGETAIYAFLTDNQQNVWIGTENGLYRLNAGKRSIEPFWYRNQNPITAPTYALLQDPLGKVWIGTQEGIFVYQPQNDELKHFTHNPTQIGTLSSDIVKAFAVDKKGQLWVGTYGGGLLLYNYTTETFQAFRQTDDNPYSLSDDMVQSLICDRTGILWVGTYDGLNKFDPEKDIFVTYQSEISPLMELIRTEVWAVVEDENQGLWVGTDKGLYHYHKESPLQKLRTLTHYQADVRNEKALAGNKILALLKDSRHQIWVGTEGGGLHLFQKESKTFKRFEMADERKSQVSPYLYDNNIWALCEDKYGEIWVGTSNGLSRYNPKTQLFKHYSEKEGLPDHNIWTIYQDRYGIVWIGTSNGLVRYERDSDSFQIYGDSKLNNTYIISLFESKDGTFWVGTQGGGISRFNKENDAFETYNEREGLPDGIVYGFAQDNKQNLWISTNRGLSRFDVQAKLFRNFDINDGLHSNKFNHQAAYRTQKGELIFGSIGGLNIFHPDSIRDYRYDLPVYITALKVFNPNKKINNENYLHLRQAEQNLVVLSHENEVVTFEFVAIDFRSPKKMQYEYILEGFDKDWRRTNYRSRSVSYTNLPTGETYTFKVRVAHQDDKQNFATLNIYIQPPLWKRIWFRILAATVALLIVVGIYALRINRAQAHRRALARQVNERTLELETEKEKLQAAYNQIQAKNDEIVKMNEALRQKQEEVLSQKDDLERKRNQIELAFHNIRTLSEIGQQITATLNIEELVRTLYVRIQDLMDAAGFGIGVYERSTGIVEFHGYNETGQRISYQFDPKSDKNLLSQWCLRHGQEILIGDLQTEYVKYVSGEVRAVEGSMPKSVIYLPLYIKHRPIGVVTVQSLQKNAYSNKDLTLLKGLASYVAIALDNAKNYAALEESKYAIEKSNQRITDSIRYAQTIQEAILPTKAMLQNCFEEHFVIFRPKDVVSGDFYWLREIDGRVFVAVADCTGHGVPGAFMSMIGSRLLNEIIDEAQILEPAQILDQLHLRLCNALKQDQTQNDDGMDIALCRVDALEENGERELVFAGAKRPMFLVSEGQGQLIKGDRRSIGGGESNMRLKRRPFIQLQLTVKRGDALYLWTDGITDQNNLNLQKIGQNELTKLIVQNADFEMQDQKEVLEEALQRHQGTQKQRDDITVMGIRL